MAVCEVMEDTIEKRAVSSNGVTTLFADVRKTFFRMYCERYLAECERMAARREIKDGTAFKMMPFECSSNGLHGTFQWAKVKARLEALRRKLLDEVDEWRTIGAQQTTMLREKRDASVNSCIHHLGQQEERIKAEAPDGASIGPNGLNSCIWEATIFGPADTPLDGGMFGVEVVFPPEYPETPPYVRFTSAMFHPQISPAGLPYLRSLLLWHCCEPKERTIGGLLQQLVALLTTDPSPEPATHLNTEAANLYFSRSPDDHKEYKKRVKRAAQRSVDG